MKAPHWAVLSFFMIMSVSVYASYDIRGIIRR